MTNLIRLCSQEDTTIAEVKADLLNNKHVANYINAQNVYGEDALMWASIWGHTYIAQLLINMGANVNNADKVDKKTALMWASYIEDFYIVECLINMGANVNLKDKYGNTAFMFACHKKNTKIAELIKKHI